MISSQSDKTMINSIKLLQVNKMAMRYCNWNGWDNDMSQIAIQVYKMISLLDQFLLGIKLSQYHKYLFTILV